MFLKLKRNQVKRNETLFDYKNCVRETFLANLEICYRVADASQLEQTRKEGENTFNEVYNTSLAVSKAFDKFVGELNDKTVKLIKTAENMETLLAQLHKEKLELGEEAGGIRSHVLKLEQTWSDYKAYQHMLFRILPGFHAGNTVLSSDETEIASNKARSSIFIRLETLMNDLRKAPLAVKIAESPDTVLQNLERMEKTGLELMIKKEKELAFAADVRENFRSPELSKSINKLSLKTEIDLLIQTAECDELRAIVLKEKSLSLATWIRDTLMLDNEIINLHIGVENAYLKCVADREQDPSILQMMRALDSETQNVLAELNNHPRPFIQNAETTLRKEERLLIMNERKLQEDFKQIQALRRTFETREPLKRMLKWRSQPPDEPVTLDEQVEKKVISNQMKQFLDFFSNIQNIVFEEEFNELFPNWDPTLIENNETDE